MNEANFGRLPESNNSQLGYLKREIERFRTQGDNLMVARTMASAAEEMVQHSPDFDSTELGEAFEYMVGAAELFDKHDNPIDGWRQRARLLTLIQDYNRWQLREAFVDKFGVDGEDAVKAEMELFAAKLLTYKSSVSDAPRYSGQQAYVDSENQRLKVAVRNGVSSDPAW